MDGTPLFVYLTKFPIWMERLGYAKSTIISYTRQLRVFFNWLMLHHIHDIAAIHPSILENYNHYLHTRTNQLFGGGLSTSSIQSHLNVIRLFDQYLQHIYHQQILHGALPVTQTAPTPRSILTQAEVILLYNATDQSMVGYRDRAILPLYYGCGLRRSEGAAVQLNHMHYGQCLLQVVPSKTKQSRYVPMSNHVWQHLQDYQHYSRPYLVGSLSNNYLILNNKGSPVHPNNMGCYFKQLLAKTTITKEISLHHLRHSIASHLLQSGMPLEQISRFLGHKQLNSTQIYTRIVEEMNHGISVYNPWSTLRFLDSAKLENYWYESGSSSLLINQMLSDPDRFDLNMDNLQIEATRDDLMYTESRNEISLKSLMFQTGYLTIDNYNESTGLYTLKFPNREIEASFQKSIQSSLEKSVKDYFIQERDKIRNALSNKKIKSFIDSINTAFATLPYYIDTKQEKQYHSNLHMLLQGLGFLGGRKMHIHSESASSQGRSDIVLELETAIYIIEIKYRSSGKIALQQIKENGYYKPYLLKQKTIILLGINFNEETRMIDNWDYEIHEEHLEE